MEDIQTAVNKTADSYNGESKLDLKIMLCDFALEVIRITTDRITAGITKTDAHK